MSRRYEMDLSVKGYTGAADALHDALQEIFDFDLTFATADLIAFGGTGCLYGGESEEEFLERVSTAVWETNGGYCEVTLETACLEYVPRETHETTKDMYETWESKRSTHEQKH